MCNIACVRFGELCLTHNEIAGKNVLEVGALNVNGSLRSFIEKQGPSHYIGVDLVEGPGVDEVCDVSELVARFGKESFDWLSQLNF